MLTGIVDSLLDVGDGPCRICASVRLWSGGEEKSLLPVSVFLRHADVKSRLAPGDFVDMEPSLVAKSLICYEELPDDPELEAEAPQAGVLPPLGVIRRRLAVAPSEPGGRMVLVDAEIADVAFEEAKVIPFCSARELVRLSARTPYGMIAVVHVADRLTQRQRKLLKPGSRVRMEGWLGGDLCFDCGEEGVYFEIHHDLELLAVCLRQRNHARAMRVFSGACRFTSPRGVSAEGPAAVAGALDVFARGLDEENPGGKILFGMMEEPEDPESHHVAWEKCLVCLTSEETVHALLFAEVDDDGKICQLTVEYGLGEGIHLEWTADSVDWFYWPGPGPKYWPEYSGNGLAGPLFPEDPEPEDPLFQEALFPEDGGGTDREPWDAGTFEREGVSLEDGTFSFEEAAAVGRLRGEASSFSGPPYFDFGRQWRALDLDVQNMLPGCLDQASEAARFSALGSGKPAAYRDRALDDACTMRIAGFEGEDGFRPLDVFPVLQGRPGVVEVRAAFDAASGLCGCIVAGLPGCRHPLEFFVPSYGAVHRLLVPGATVGMTLSGLASNLYVVQRGPSVITEGPRYEAALADFQKAHPEASEADFEPPILDWDKVVLVLPRGAMAWRGLMAPAREVARVFLCGRRFFRMLVPVNHTEEGRELLAGIYVPAQECHEVPEPGVLIGCTVWLCADCGGKDLRLDDVESPVLQ